MSGEYNIDGVKAVQWGRDHEKQAIKEFEEATQYKVVPTGVWLHKSGLLGASPDGLIIEENAIIEVKCPFSMRSVTSLNSEHQSKKYVIFL